MPLVATLVPAEGRTSGAHRIDEWPLLGHFRLDVNALLERFLERLLERPETAVLAVSHALPVRYVLDAAAGRVPRRRVEPVAHVVPLVLSSDEVARAAAILAGWSRAPRFRDGDDA